jgi:hypothetical protein
MTATELQTIVLGFVAASTLFVAVLTVLQGRFLARMLDQIIAGDRAIYLQGYRIEESVKDIGQGLKARG